jgi:hypothetical protein
LAVRRALAGLAVALFGLAVSPPVSAHQGDGLAQPIIETMSPAVPGITVEVAYSVNYQFIVSNTTPQPITILADTGEPFLRVGPDGVEGNFASPALYDSNAPNGRLEFPPQAKAGADVPPNWRRLSRQPNWGWYDHRLHPAGQVLPPEVRTATEPVVLGRWKVPIRVGDQAGEVQGRFEFRPPTGSYGMVQKSSQTPVDGVKIQVASGRVVPAIYVENRSPDPVVVLGRDGEPFARIGPAVSEVNVRSPTWAEIQQANGQDPSDETDPRAEPKWQKVADGPSWFWLEFRAAAPKDDPPAAVIRQGKAVTVRNWSIPYLVGDRRDTIEGITEFVPVAALQDRATGGAEQDEGADLAFYGGAALATAVLAAGIWLVTSKVRSRRAA